PFFPSYGRMISRTLLLYWKYWMTQFIRAITLFLNPTNETKCTNIHTNQANQPANFHPGRSTTALSRPMVAMEPLSLYRNGFMGLAMFRLLRFAAKSFPCWMATWATM